MTVRKDWDVIVVGAGPAGCSAAIVLAELGRDVLVLERERFPRYHIGESLIPFTCEPLRRLGLIDAMRKSSFVKKHSVQFVSASGRQSEPFYFASRYDEEIAQTWQVLRSEFDLMLMNHARGRGATIAEETSVTRFVEENGAVVGVEGVNKDGEPFEYLAPMTLDCTGRNAVAALQNRWRVPDAKLNKVAVWTYYRGAGRDEGLDAGATTAAFVPHKGWFWYIPLHDGLTSVGVVADGKYLSRGGVRDPKEMFEREIGRNKWIESRLAEGTQEGEYFLTHEFSYHSRYCSSNGLLLVGDAYCFLDPIFSSGLMFALKSGVLAGDATHAALNDGDFSSRRFESYGRDLRRGIENFRTLIYAFYDPDFSFGELIRKYPEVKDDITDCLSGDIDKDFSRLHAAIADFVKIPEAMTLGRPFVGDEVEAEPVSAASES